jgi:Protein of unknown function (DUF1176)
MKIYLHAAAIISSLTLISAVPAQYQSNTKGTAGAAGTTRDPQGVYFQHKDWELACDNTGTCRAAGYAAEGADSGVASVLLTRAAGPSAPVRMRFKAQDERKGDEMNGEFTLKLGGVNVGRFSFEEDIPAVATQRVLPQFLSAQHMDLVIGVKSWRISLAGLGAVALKMDEVQKRVGTTGALAPSARGKQDETSVTQPMPVAVINVPKLPATGGVDKALLKSLTAAIGKTDCSAERPEITGEKLNNRQIIVQISPCEQAAYNSESAFYIANIQASHAPIRVELDGPAQDFSDGIISGYHKGRGIGDCISSAEYAWDGTRFVKANLSGSGMCRGFLGGAWELPTAVSKINNVNAASKKK